MKIDGQKRLFILIASFLKRNQTALAELNTSAVFAAVQFAIYEERGQFAGWQICVHDVPQYRYLLDDQLQPILEDAAGHQLAMPISIPITLPSAEKRILWRTNEAGGWFKVLIEDFRQQLPAVLESEMLCETPWQGTEFIRQFIAAPLLRGISQRLVWGIYHDGKLMETMRPSEDETLVNVHSETLSPPDDALQISIIHPALLTPDERHHWGVHLHDYQIIQPFAQIGRDVYTLEAMPDKHEQQGTWLLWSFPARISLATIEESTSDAVGWTFFYSGGIQTLQRHFPSSDLRVVVGNPSSFASRRGRLLTCRFETPHEQINPAEVPPVVLSEALHLITRLLRYDT